MSFNMLRIIKLAATDVTIELSDSGMLRHVTTQVCSRQETFTANLAPVRVAPSVCGFVGSQAGQSRIAPMTLRTLVFNRATRHCALQKQNTDFATAFHIFHNKEQTPTIEPHFRYQILT